MTELSMMYDPPHPGEFLHEVYLLPSGLSIRELARRLGVTPSTLQRLLVVTSGVSPEMAVRLSAVLGRSAESWLAMQAAYDLWRARQSVDVSSLDKLPLAPSVS
jgi:addiction module HigA family antidote